MPLTTGSTTYNIVLLIARVALGLMILAHGYAKVFRGGKLAGTAGWFDSIGMSPGKINAYMAAGTEIGVGILLTIGFLVPLAAAGLVALMTVAIVTVHRKNGFFVYNAGQGIEYCLMIIVLSIVVGTLGGGKYSIDGIHGHIHWLDANLHHSLATVVVVGFGGALLQLAAVYRPGKVKQA